MMEFKSLLSEANISAQGIRGVVLTDIIWDTGENIERHVNNEAFASYYKTVIGMIEWTARFDHKGAGFYMSIIINKISGTHFCEFDRDDVDDHEIEFEFNDDLDSKWELKAQSYYDAKDFAFNAIPHAIFPKGLEIDYNAKECVVYFGR